MTIERRIIFSPKDLIVRLICKNSKSGAGECGAEIFVPFKESARNSEYHCSQCGEQWSMHFNWDSIEALFIQFLRDVVGRDSEDLAIVLEIKDPRG